MTLQAKDKIIYEQGMRLILPPPIDGCPLLAESAVIVTSNRQCTALRRGYIATWSIDCDSLWLLKIGGLSFGDGDETHSKWGRIDIKEPVFAKWVSTVLEIPDGEMLDAGYEHQVPERSICLEIERGRVVGTILRDNKEAAAARSAADAAERAKLKARIAASRLEKKKNEVDLPKETPIESQALKFLEIAMIGDVNRQTMVEWRNFYVSSKTIANPTELSFLEITNNAYKSIR